MHVSKFTHPKAFAFLVTQGFLPGDPTCTSHALIGAPALLRGLFNSDPHSQELTLKPLILETLSAFYVHQDAQFALNMYMSELFPTYNSESYEVFHR